MSSSKFVKDKIYPDVGSLESRMLTISVGDLKIKWGVFKNRRDQQSK